MRQLQGLDGAAHPSVCCGLAPAGGGPARGPGPPPHLHPPHPLCFPRGVAVDGPGLTPMPQDRLLICCCGGSAGFLPREGLRTFPSRPCRVSPNKHPRPARGRALQGAVRPLATRPFWDEACRSEVAMASPRLHLLHLESLQQGTRCRSGLFWNVPFHPFAQGAVQASRLWSWVCLPHPPSCLVLGWIIQLPGPSSALLGFPPCFVWNIFLRLLRKAVPQGTHFLRLW